VPLIQKSPKKDAKKATGAVADHRTKNPKAGLKGVGFAQGAAALAPAPPTQATPAKPAKPAPAKVTKPAPVQAAPAPVQAAPAPVQAAPEPVQAAQAPAPPAMRGLGIFADDPVVAQAPAPPVMGGLGIFADPVAAQGPAAGPVETAEERAEREKQTNVDYWCDPTLDDRAQVESCVSKKATPDRFASDMANAEGFIRQLEKDPAEYRRHAKTMSRDDMVIVALYTTQAAYALNGVLRGLLKSARWVDTFKPVASKLASALAKVPKGAKNMQAGKKLDPKESGTKIVNFDRLYRNDDWNPVFEKVFAEEYQVGRVLEDPAFFSATMIKDSYKPSAPVKRTIEGVSMARSITSLSGATEEREALFPPGLRLQIASIWREDRVTKQKLPVDAPGIQYPISDDRSTSFNNGGRFVWHIRLKQVSAPDAGAKKDAPAKDKAGKAPAPEPSKSSFLEKLLGVGHTVD